MKRKIWIAILLLTASIACLFGFAACDSKTENSEQGHTHSYTETVVAPTCTEDGYTLHSCSCGDSFTDTEKLALGHAYGEWQTTQKATCTTAGTQTRVCANNSSHKETQTINALGHSYGEWQTTKKATCTTAGTQTRICANNSSHTETQTINALGHSYGDWETTKKATCTTAGTQTRVCANDSSHKETQTINALGHSYGEWKTTKEATCTEEGEQERICSADNAMETKTISATGHTWTSGNYCSVCYTLKSNTSYTQNLEYTLSDDKTYYTVTGIGYATDQFIVLPSTVNGKPLKAIGEMAFGSRTAYKTNIVGIYIPSSIERIGDYAFENCTNLTVVNIQSGLKQIGVDAFLGCTKLNDITLPDTIEKISERAFSNTAYYNNEDNWVNHTTLYIDNYLIQTRYTALETSYVLRSGTRLIADSAYKNCVNLLNVSFANTVKYIGSYAFANCQQLSSIQLPNSLISLGDYAFYNCTDLASVTMGGNLSYIGTGAFYGCTKLTSASIPNQVNTIGESVFYGCSSLKSASLKYLTSIPQKMFYGCSSLTTVELGQNITIISDYAFYGCSALKTISLPKSLTTICDWAFTNCSALQQLTIPDSVTSIGSQSVFMDCTSLKTVTIGNGLTTLPKNLFEGCTNIVSITLPFVGGEKEATQASEKTLFGYIFSETSKTGTTAIKQYYASSNYKTYYIPSTLQTVVITDGKLLYGAFYGCTTLTSITLPSDITSIAAYTFYGCSGLKEMVISSSITSIGSYAFYGCSNVTIYAQSASKPSGWASNWNPSNCSVIWNYKGTVVDSQGVTYRLLNDNTAEIIGYNDSSTSLNLTEVDGMPITKIPSGVFNNCTKLKEVLIGKTVSVIDSSAFSGCTKLKIYVQVETKPTDWSDSWNDSDLPVVWNYKETYIDEQGVTYILKNDSTAYVIAYNGNVENLVLISAKDCRVVEIQNTPFSSNKTIKRITLGEGITAINSNEFCDCKNLTDIIMPSITSIGDYAFYGCSKLTSIDIPNSVTSIGSYSFYNCSGLTSATIGNAVISIGPRAFYNCSDLTSINIPKSVTSIGTYAFYGCSGLTSIVIPNNVTSIGNATFGACSSLESITLPFVGDSKKSASDTYQYPFGYIFGTSSYTAGVVTRQYYYGSSTTYNDYYIPASLKSVTITNGNIFYGAFYNCSNLTSIDIPNGVTSIGDYAFYNCSSLTSIVIPDNVTSIGDYAFYNCSSLTSIVIPNNVTSIDGRAFNECEHLTIYAEATSKPSGWNSSWNGSYLPIIWNYGGEHGITEYGFIWGLRKDNSIAIAGYNGNLTDIALPDTINDIPVTSIAQYSFYGCSNLTSIDIPNSVISIGSYSFYNCSGLTSINLPNVVTSIDSYAFYGCRDLISIVVPDSVTSIGSYAFYDCSGLTSINLPNGVTSIDSYAFYDCSGLTSITMPDNMTSIGENAFKDCSSLTGVYISDMAAWCNISFSNAISNPLYYAHSLYLNGTLVSELEIPNSVTTINFAAFYHCTSLTSVTISKTVTSICKSAFYNCRGLTSIIIPNSVTSIGSYAFDDCSNLVIYAEVGSAPDGWSSSWNGSYLPIIWNYGGEHGITEDGFIWGLRKDNTIAVAGYNGNLTDITFPNTINDISVTSIAQYSFYGCSNLTSIVVPDSVIFIGDYAFYNCSGLTSINLPNGVTSINYAAFHGCSSLESIILPFVGNSKKSASDAYQYPFGYIFGTSSYTGAVAVKQYYYGSSTSSTTSTTYYIPSSLKSVTITGGNILQGAFYNCNFIETLILPNGLSSIVEYALYNCDSLIYNQYENCNYLGSESNPYLAVISPIDTSVTNFSLHNNTVIIYSQAFYDYDTLENISIGNKIKSIGSYAFYGCTNLQEITVPTGITAINDYTFYRCSSLTTISIPQSVKTIGAFAFAGCESLTNIQIPNSVTTIKNNAFAACSSLKNIVIPDSVTTIGKETFYNCIALESITLPFTGGSKEAITNDYTTVFGYIFGYTIATSSVSGATCQYAEYKYDADTGKGKNYYYYYYIPSSIKNVTIAGATKILAYSFDNCKSIKNIVISNSVTYIGEEAFANCESLRSISLPFIGSSKNATSSSKSTALGYIFNISSSGPSYCHYKIPSSLKTVYITGGPILDNAFDDCDNIKTIIISNNITSISSNAFYECTALAEVYYCGTIDEWKNISIGSGNSYLTSAARYYYSESEPTESGNYWRYDTDGITPIIWNKEY